MWDRQSEGKDLFHSKCIENDRALRNVLRDDEREHPVIEAVIEYIARNPERKGLVPIDGFASYPYTGCLIPGYPQMRLFQREGWEELWRTVAFLKRTLCFRVPDPKHLTRE